MESYLFQLTALTVNGRLITASNYVLTVVFWTWEGNLIVLSFHHLSCMTLVVRTPRSVQTAQTGSLMTEPKYSRGIVALSHTHSDKLVIVVYR